jgi:hypothetical protein
MVPLSSPEWSRLQHAYGSAENIPALLQQLDSFPSSDGSAEPWFTRWSSLMHQADVYPASLAAVPHVVSALASAPTRAGFDYFLFPACVEVARVKGNVALPNELVQSYTTALARLPRLAAEVARPGLHDALSQSALAAFAVAVGNVAWARLLVEVESRDLPELMEWYVNR